MLVCVIVWQGLAPVGEQSKAYFGAPHGVPPLTPTGGGRSMGHNRGDRPHEVYHPEIEPVSPSADEPDDDAVSSAFSSTAGLLHARLRAIYRIAQHVFRLTLIHFSASS